MLGAMVTLVSVLMNMSRKTAGVILFRQPSLRVEGALFHNFIHIYINGANSRKKKPGERMNQTKSLGRVFAVLEYFTTLVVNIASGTVSCCRSLL